jgi:preprotein translocase subunit SecB
MLNSLLRLNDCIVKSLEIHSRAGGHFDAVRAPEHGDANVSISFSSLRNQENPMQFLVPLKIEVTWSEDVQHTFEKIMLEIYGYFSFPDATPEDEITNYVPLLCLTNLYGVARGIIAQSTGPFPEGSFFLPVVNMLEVVQGAVNSQESNSSAE